MFNKGCQARGMGLCSQSEAGMAWLQRQGLRSVGFSQSLSVAQLPPPLTGVLPGRLQVLDSKVSSSMSSTQLCLLGLCIAPRHSFNPWRTQNYYPRL